MSQSELKTTSYVGAHAWSYRERAGWDWECTCGKQGRSVGGGEASLLVQFAQHAHDALQEAAVALLVAHMWEQDTYGLQQEIDLLRDRGRVQERGAGDRANLLQYVVNERYHEGQK